jgi:hypothetical protein
MNACRFIFGCACALCSAAFAVALFNHFVMCLLARMLIFKAEGKA